MQRRPTAARQCLALPGLGALLGSGVLEGCSRPVAEAATDAGPRRAPRRDASATTAATDAQASPPSPHTPLPPGGLGQLVGIGTPMHISGGPMNVTPVGPPQGTVRVTTVTTTGPLTQEDARRVALRHLTHARQCYAAVHGVGRGGVVVRYAVAQDGTVASAVVRAASFPTASVVECLRTEVATWRFPPRRDQAPVSAEVTFGLSPGA